MKYVTIKLPDNFEKGNCFDCPFSHFNEYTEYECMFYCDSDDCPLEVKETEDEYKPKDSLVDLEAFDFMKDLGKMRSPTAEERKSVNLYIEKISKHQSDMSDLFDGTGGDKNGTGAL